MERPLVLCLEFLALEPTPSAVALTDRDVGVGDCPNALSLEYGLELLDVLKRYLFDVKVTSWSGLILWLGWLDSRPLPWSEIHQFDRPFALYHQLVVLDFPSFSDLELVDGIHEQSRGAASLLGELEELQLSLLGLDQELVLAVN